MLKVGLTGGIGSGKSLVATILKLNAYPVYNSDFEAKQLCNNSVELRNKLQNVFGNEIYTNGILNKQAFASIIFSNLTKLQEANQIIHPFVTNDFLAWAENQNSELVFIESAILFESELIKVINKSITVSAPEKVRIQRVMERDGIEESLVLERMKNQLPETVRILKADYIIYNDDKQSIISQLNTILSLLQ